MDKRGLPQLHPRADLIQDLGGVEIDPVIARKVELQSIPLRRRDGLPLQVFGSQVDIGAQIDLVLMGIEVEHGIVPGARGEAEHITARATAQLVVGSVGPKGIVLLSGQGVFNARAISDGDVFGQPNAAEVSFAQVEHNGRARAFGREGVIPSGIPQGGDSLLARFKAVGVIATVRLGIGPIHGLQGLDVEQHIAQG